MLQLSISEVDCEVRGQQTPTPTTQRQRPESGMSLGASWGIRSYPLLIDNRFELRYGPASAPTPIVRLHLRGPGSLAGKCTHCLTRTRQPVDQGTGAPSDSGLAPGLFESARELSRSSRCEIQIRRAPRG